MASNHNFKKYFPFGELLVDEHQENFEFLILNFEFLSGRRIITP